MLNIIRTGITKTSAITGTCTKAVSSFIARSVHTLQIGETKETIITREDMSIDNCKDIIGSRTIASLGYGPQGRGQMLNLRDNGFNVVVGLRKGRSWDKALEDGWVEGENLIEYEEACYKGDIIKYLVSDAAQIQMWPMVKSNLHKNNTLYFSHGFGIVYNDQTKIVPPENVDVVLVAPKGPGGMLRDKFVSGSGINSSFAVHQDFTGNAYDTVKALGFGIGSNHLFETTFTNEVFSDLTGERCILMGMIQAAFKAQYDVLRENGHSPSEAFNETVEEALVSLYPLINEKGMDWMFRNCSTTAQRGAIDWSQKFYDPLKIAINDCYESVRSGEETRRAIECNSDPNYREKLEKELEEIDQQEIWQVGRELRKLRDL